MGIAHLATPPNIPDRGPAPVPDTKPATRGRVLAIVYLVVIILGVIAQAFIADRLVVTGDAAKTASNILGARAVYQLGCTLFIIEMVAQVAVTAMFYDLLKPVGRRLARFGAVMGFVGAGIKMFARVFYYAPLILLGGANYLSTIGPAQLATLSLVSIRINNQAAGIALVFFGVETIMFGWLMYRAGFLPRFLGVISMIGGLGWLTFIWPPLGSKAFILVAPFAIVGVMVTAGWLLFRGIDNRAWYERVTRMQAMREV